MDKLIRVRYINDIKKMPVQPKNIPTKNLGFPRIGNNENPSSFNNNMTRRASASAAGGGRMTIKHRIRKT